MEWQELYPKDRQPTMAQIAEHVASPLWSDFLAHMGAEYGVTAPSCEHSTCGGAPGWNLKFKKSGRSLCTVYPRNGYFICLVCIGARQATEAELLLPGMTKQIRELYQGATPLVDTRWLMINVKDEQTLADVEKLIELRRKYK